jgi:hypothetical protein
MTPIYAVIWGSVRVIAVPDDCNIEELEDYKIYLEDLRK